MRKLLVVMTAVALLASFSVFVAADSNDYNLENAAVAVTQTETYEWDLDVDFLSADTDVDSGEAVEGSLWVGATRTLVDSTLGFDLDLDVVGAEEAPGASKEALKVYVQYDPADTEDGNWETMQDYDFDLSGTVTAEDLDSLDQSFELELLDFTPEEQDDFLGADSYRLLVEVELREGSSDFTLTEEVPFSLPDPEDVVSSRETYDRFVTDVFDALADAGVDYGTTTEDDWDIAASDPDVITGLLPLELTADDGEYDVPVDVEFYVTDEEDPLVAETLTLSLEFGDADTEDEAPVGDRDRERDREAWADGLHPVHGFWMPPAANSVHGNQTLPLKFWLPDGVEEPITVQLYDDDDDLVYETDELLNENGGLCKVILHLRGLALEPGEYYLVIVDDNGDIVTYGDDEEAVLRFEVVEPGNGRGGPLGPFGTDDPDDEKANPGHGHAKGRP